eukprot:m.244290 g.244290  ORF g.244290 m.244290 type:complete len:395 (+) comp22558_c1_seq6:2224-3408(+)
MLRETRPTRVGRHGSDRPWQTAASAACGCLRQSQPLLFKLSPSLFFERGGGCQTTPKENNTKKKREEKLPMSDDENGWREELEQSLSQSLKKAKQRHDGEEKEEAAEAASDDEDGERCAICLCPFDDKSALPTCFHYFCFQCIMTWASVARCCPLCKAPFCAVVHNIVSDSIFEQVKLEPLAKPGPLLPAPRSRASAATSSSSSTTTTTNPSRRRNLECRFASSMERRRLVYATGARALPEHDPRLMSRLRDISPAYFRMHPSAVRRLIPWLARDLSVLLSPDNANFVQCYIISLLDRVDFREPDAVLPLLRPYLLQHTEQLLHELVQFALSPLDMARYDDHVKFNITVGGHGASNAPAASTTTTATATTTTTAAVGNGARCELGLAQFDWARL